ncbi:MAG: glycosyltransferase family 39 protein [Chloroflexota bacterium]
MPYAAALALVGLALWHAGVQPLWMDETYGLLFAQRPFSALLQALAASEPHLPPYFLALRAWEALAGPSAFAERWPSAACLLLTGLVVFRLAGMLAGRAAGWLGFGFWAIQPEGFWYGQEVRMYAPLIFWTALALWLLLRAMRSGRRRDWLLFSLAELAALWTHYSGAFVPLVAGTMVLAFLSRSQWRPAFGWIGWPALTYLPWLWYVRHIQPPTARPTGTLAEQILAVGRGLLLGFGGPSLPAVLAIALIVVLTATVAGAVWSRQRPLQLIACPIAVVLFVPLLISPFHFLFNERYLCLVCPLLCVLWAVTIRVLDRRCRPAAVCLAVVIGGASLAGMAVVLAPNFRLWYDYPPAMAFVRQHEQAGQLVINDSGVDPTARYYYQNVDRGTLPVLLLVPFHPGSVPAVESTAVRLAQRYSGVWLPQDAAGTWDGDRVVQRALDATLIPAGHQQFRDVSLRFYLTARGLAGQQPADALFAGSVQLAGYGVQRSGDQWFVALHWHAVRTLNGDRTVFVHVVDAGGHLVVQGDGPPDAGRQPTAAWTAGSDVFDLHRLSIPASPGAVHLVVGWYDPATNHRLILPSGADSVDLGPLP